MPFSLVNLWALGSFLAEHMVTPKVQPALPRRLFAVEVLEDRTLLSHGAAGTLLDNLASNIGGSADTSGGHETAILAGLHSSVNGGGDAGGSSGGGGSSSSGPGYPVPPKLGPTLDTDAQVPFQPVLHLNPVQQGAAGLVPILTQEAGNPLQVEAITSPISFAQVIGVGLPQQRVLNLNPVQQGAIGLVPVLTQVMDASSSVGKDAGPATEVGGRLLASTPNTATPSVPQVPGNAMVMTIEPERSLPAIMPPVGLTMNGSAPDATFALTPTVWRTDSMPAGLAAQTVVPAMASKEDFVQGKLPGSPAVTSFVDDAFFSLVPAKEAQPVPVLALPAKLDLSEKGQLTVRAAEGIETAPPESETAAASADVLQTEPGSGRVSLLLNLAVASLFTAGWVEAQRRAKKSEDAKAAVLPRN